MVYMKKWDEATNKLLELMCELGKVWGNKSIHKNQLYFLRMNPKSGSLGNVIFSLSVV